MKKNKTGAVILGVAFVWFTTHFGGGFASGAQIYSYFVRYGIWSLIMPVLAMLYNTVFFAYSLRFARKHEVYDYRSYNNEFYGRFAPIFSNLFEILYICVMCVAPAVAFATGGATLSTLTGLPYLFCTFLIGVFIFVVAIVGTDLVRKVASVLSICIIAGLLIVYIPNIISGLSGISEAAESMTQAELPLGDALYSAFLYGTFQLSNIAVFVQHAKSFDRPGDAVKSNSRALRCGKCADDGHGRAGTYDDLYGPGSCRTERADALYGTERRGRFFHDSAHFHFDHPRRCFYSCQYGSGNGEENLRGEKKYLGKIDGEQEISDHTKRDHCGAHLLYRGFRDSPVRAAYPDPESVQFSCLSCNTGYPHSVHCSYDSDKI